jgi:hypothetical protein
MTQHRPLTGKDGEEKQVTGVAGGVSSASIKELLGRIDGALLHVDQGVRSQISSNSIRMNQRESMYIYQKHRHKHMFNAETMECTLTTQKPCLPMLSARQGAAFPCSSERERESDRGKGQRHLRCSGSGETAHAPRLGIHPSP